MLVHPNHTGFTLHRSPLAPNAVFGTRCFVLLSDARFVIDVDKQASAAGRRLPVHAWCQGTVVASVYGAVPSDQQYDGWSEVTYTSAVGARFMVAGSEVDPLDVYSIVVCTRLHGRSVVLVKKSCT